MTWSRFSDDWPHRPEVVGLTDAAFRTHVHAIVYVAKWHTDGLVPTTWVPQRRLGNELVKAGLWEPVDGGWLVLDWHDHVPSRAELARWRDATADRVRRHRKGKQ